MSTTTITPSTSATQSNPTAKVTDIEDGWLFDGPGTTTAMVFYPGARVEASTYAPLMQETAASGIDCFLMKMPANLAIFGINRADVVRSDIAGYSYDHWYIADHSLGGTLAANSTSANIPTTGTDSSSYPTADLSKTKLRVLSAYGSKDDILNLKKSRIRTLARAEAALRTGNQGSYGVQQGDGVALFPVMTRLIGPWRLFSSSSPTVFELSPFPIAIRFDFSVSDQYGVGPATLGAQFHFERLHTCVGAVP